MNRELRNRLDLIERKQWDMVPVALCPVEWSAILTLYRASERHDLIGASLGARGRML